MTTHSWIKGQGRSVPPWPVILVEREPLWRDLLAVAIRTDERFDLLAEVEDGAKAEEICRRITAGLVLVGVRPPHLDKIEIAKRLRRRFPRIRVLVLAERYEPVTVGYLCDSGAHGCVTWADPWEVLAEGMSEVASGGTYFTASYIRLLRNLARDTAASAKILSEREREILGWVASGRTSRTIARHLNLSHRSIETYRYRIMRKISVGNLAELIDYALRNGLVQSPSSSVSESDASSRGSNLWGCRNSTTTVRS